jgi:hypothetical protein
VCKGKVFFDFVLVEIPIIRQKCKKYGQLINGCASSLYNKEMQPQPSPDRSDILFFCLSKKDKTKSRNGFKKGFATLVCSRL